MKISGYEASTKNLNSPEIMRLAYGPEMNAHIDQIKKQRKSVSDSGSNDIALEASDRISIMAKARVSVTSKTVEIKKMKPRFCYMCGERAYTVFIIDAKTYGDCHKAYSKMSNAERRKNNLHQDPDLPDFKKPKPMVQQPKRIGQTKGVSNGT